MIDKSGSAVWTGSLKEGKGQVSTESGALSAIPYSFATRFGGSQGSNPEELLGAAHAACFSMALSNVLGGKGITPDRIETTSKVTLDPSGPAISKVHLTVAITADADEAALLEAAEAAKVSCPVSKLYKAEITMDARKG